VQGVGVLIEAANIVTAQQHQIRHDKDQKVQTYLAEIQRKGKL